MPEKALLSNEANAYKVDFTWKKLKGIITDNKTNEHIMNIDFKKLRKPHLLFITEEEGTIGTASFNVVSIHAECEVRGQPKRLQAMKRWTTEYTYLSDAFANGGSPVPMYWTSSSGFKTWDFILLDSAGEPVARFRSNVWAVTKLGIIEFMGDYPARTKQEICITGFSVYCNWAIRMNNPFQIIGAIGGKTGPVETKANDMNTDVRTDSVPKADADELGRSETIEVSKDTTVR